MEESITIINSNRKVIVYMVVKDIMKRNILFKQVIERACRITKRFYIVNHGSHDNTEGFIKKISYEYNLDLDLINENFVGTMDDMKGKHYKILRQKYGKAGKYILALDWDEVMDELLVHEIKKLDFKKDIYFLNINTYFISQVVDKNHFQPRLFNVCAVEMGSFSKYHNLFKIHSKNGQKLKGILHHYSYENMDDLLRKNSLYAKGEAEALFAQKSNISSYMIFIKFFYDSVRYFLYTLLYHKNFITLEGWFFSFSNIVYMYTKYIFYMELKNRKDD